MAFKNKRGANIKIGKIRPNTYNEYSGCTVDIHIFVYNDTETRRCKFWLLDYNTSWSGNDLLDGVYEAELENNDEFVEDMELSDIYSDEELEKMVWDAIMAEWEFYPEDCPFLDYINRIEDALSNMAQEDFEDVSSHTQFNSMNSSYLVDGNVEDPDIDALLARREAKCWDTLDETGLVDFEAMEKDGVVDIEEDCWGEKDYASLVDDFEKEDRKSDVVDSIKDKLDEALEHATAYCRNNNTNCLALPYAICKAVLDTHFVVPWETLDKTQRIIVNTDWESKSAADTLLAIRTLLLTELKKSRWVDSENHHYRRYKFCEETLERSSKKVRNLTELLEKLCHVRPHDKDVSFEFTTDKSNDIRRLKEEYNIVMPHKILYDFLVDAKLKDEYSKQAFHVESYYGSEGYDKSRLTFIRDDVFEQINDRIEGKVIKDVFDTDILLKEYEGETFVQQILDAEADDDFYEETEDGFFTSRGIRYFCTDHEYTYTGRDWVAENPGFCYVEPDNIEYSGKVHIPSHVMYHGKSYPVTNISSEAFAGCDRVTEIVIDDGVERIGCDFCDCQSLHSITIPASVTELKKDCFKECDALQVINVAKDNPRYCFVDGILYEKLDNSEKVELYHIKKLNSKIVKRGTIAGYRYTISDDQVMTIKGDGELECYGEPLEFSTKNVVIAEGFTSIGDTVYWGHGSMQTVHIPDTVVEIGDSAFGRCHSLKAPILPDSITKLGRCVFDECYGFVKITLPRNLKVLAYGVFRDCKNLQDIELSNIERIGESAFGGCVSLKKIMIPETVNYIGKEAFKGCQSLEEVIFSNSICKIEDNIFEGCQALKKVVLPASYAYRNLGNLWGRDYTSLVNDIIEFLPSDIEFPMKAIETFYREHEDNSPECVHELSQIEKSLQLNESTTIWGFATLTKVYEYGNNHNARYNIRFEEYNETIEDDWFEDFKLKSFLWKHFLSKPVDKFDGLKNAYTRYIYKWNNKRPNSRYQKAEFESFLGESKLLGEELMTPYYTLDENRKIVRLEEPTETVDTSDAFEGFMRLIGNEQGMIGSIVESMIQEFGTIKTCRVLGQLITTGNIIYHEFEINQQTHGGWQYRRNEEQISNI